AEHRHTQDRPKATRLLRFDQGVLGIRQDVRDMNGPALERSPPRRGSAPETEWVLRPGVLELAGHPVIGGQAKDLTIESKDDSAGRVTDARPVLDQGLQHRLNVERL